MGASATSSSAADATGTAVGNSKGQTMEHSGSGGGISEGEIIGLVVGVIVVLLLLIAASMYICGKQSKHKREPHRQKTLDVLARDTPPVRDLDRGVERERQYSPYQGELSHGITF
jgi:hypothetical protein